jgi:hypothetical protein
VKVDLKLVLLHVRTCTSIVPYSAVIIALIFDWFCTVPSERRGRCYNESIIIILLLSASMDLAVVIAPAQARQTTD